MKYCLLVFLSVTANYLFGQSIAFEKYFPLKNGTIQHYTVSHITETDTLPDNDNTAVCRSLMVKGKEIFFFDDNNNNGDDTTLISSESFCSGVFYYSKGAFVFSPIDWKYDVKKANLDYFESLFPATVSLNTTYKYQNRDEKKSYVFKKWEDVVIKNKLYKHCLKLIVIHDWPTKQYIDTVWFQKGVGVVKWLRSTGRLEEIKQ